MPIDREELTNWQMQTRAINEEGQRQVEQMTYLMEKYPTQDLFHEAFFHALAPDDFEGLTQKQFDQINGMYEKTGRVGKGVRPEDEDEGDTGDTGDPGDTGDTGHVPEELFDHDKIDPSEMSNLMAAQGALRWQKKQREASPTRVISGPTPPKPEYDKYRPDVHTETGQMPDPTEAEQKQAERAKQAEHAFRRIGME